MIVLNFYVILRKYLFGKVFVCWLEKSFVNLGLDWFCVILCDFIISIMNILYVESVCFLIVCV